MTHCSNMHGVVHDDSCFFVAGIDALLNQTRFSVQEGETIAIEVIADAKPPVIFANVSLVRSDNESIPNADTRITREGSSIVFKNLMATDSGNHTVVVMHPAGNMMLALTLDVCEFAVVLVVICEQLHMIICFNPQYVTLMPSLYKIVQPEVKCPGSIICFHSSALRHMLYCACFMW